MPKPPTTIAGFRSALLALGGPRCSVTCAVHYSDHVSPGHTFQSEEWTASVTVLEGDQSGRHREHELVSVRAWGHSPEDVLMKLRACGFGDRHDDVFAIVAMTPQPPAAASPLSIGNACRYCGCVYESACEGGCEWVDAEQTICSACLGQTRATGDREES